MMNKLEVSASVATAIRRQHETSVQVEMSLPMCFGEEPELAGSLKNGQFNCSTSSASSCNFVAGRLGAPAGAERRAARLSSACVSGNKQLSLRLSAGSNSSSSSLASLLSQGQVDAFDLGNKCGKCQNHDVDVAKKGHARDCPFKKCICLKCRLLDARSDILQVISGKETKLKGTKKDPNCGFCQNHGIKILRKGHVRSCSFGQERHFRLDNCFDCEVHYIRNEVNRLQIKMRRAMKEDRTLSEEQRKNSREAITRDEVEKVCDMARVARKKRESSLNQQVVGNGGGAGETSNSLGGQQVAKLELVESSQQPRRKSSGQCSKQSGAMNSAAHHHHDQPAPKQRLELNLTPAQVDTSHNQVAGVWRPWSQHQTAVVAAELEQQKLLLQQQQQQHQQHHNHHHLHHQQQQQQQHQQQRNHRLQQIQQQQQHQPPQQPQLEEEQQQPLPLVQRNFRDQQLFNTFLRLIVAQIVQSQNS